MNPSDNIVPFNNNLSEIQSLNVSHNTAIEDSKYSSFITNNKTIHHFVIILIGDVYVGKTCLISQYCDHKVSDKYQCTINIDCKRKKFPLNDTTLIDLDIYDTCGEEKFKALTRSYYRNAHGAILMFDLTNLNSFMALDQWLNDITANASKDLEVILVGNKKDLVDQCCISYEDAVHYAQGRNLFYFEISAMSGLNVDLLFYTFINRLIRKEEIKAEKERIKINQEAFIKKEAIKTKLREREEACC